MPVNTSIGVRGRLQSQSPSPPDELGDQLVGIESASESEPEILIPNQIPRPSTIIRVTVRGNNLIFVVAGY